MAPNCRGARSRVAALEGGPGVPRGQGSVSLAGRAPARPGTWVAPNYADRLCLPQDVIDEMVAVCPGEEAFKFVIPARHRCRPWSWDPEMP